MKTFLDCLIVLISSCNLDLNTYAIFQNATFLIILYRSDSNADSSSTVDGYLFEGKPISKSTHFAPQ